MNYKELYAQKLCTPEQIASHVENRWRIGMDTAASHAPTIIKAIAKRACNDELYGVRVQTLLDVQPMEHLVDERLYKKLISEAWFSGSSSRKRRYGRKIVSTPTSMAMRHFSRRVSASSYKRKRVSPSASRPV